MTCLKYFFYSAKEDSVDDSLLANLFEGVATKTCTLASCAPPPSSPPPPLVPGLGLCPIISAVVQDRLLYGAWLGLQRGH
jgi:hypothetical protein